MVVLQLSLNRPLMPRRQSRMSKLELQLRAVEQTQSIFSAQAVPRFKFCNRSKRLLPLPKPLSPICCPAGSFRTVKSKSYSTLELWPLNTELTDAQQIFLLPSKRPTGLTRPLKLSSRLSLSLRFLSRSVVYNYTHVHPSFHVVLSDHRNSMF